MMSLVNRHYYPKTGFKGDIRVLNQENIIVAQLAPSKIHIYHHSALSVPIVCIYIFLGYLTYQMSHKARNNC